MTDLDRTAFLERIRGHITTAGHHVTLVQGGASPRFAYTIGLTEADAPELVLAGATSLTADAVFAAIEVAAARVRAAIPAAGDALDVPGVGAFAFAPVHPSWAARLLLGALDYYDRDDVPALQLIPGDALRTVDVPDLAAAFDPEREPVWRWLEDESTLPVAPDAVAMTGLDVLRSAPVAWAARWEPDGWELFADRDVAADDARAIPLATLLAADPSLAPVATLAVGDALRREPPGPWEPWTAPA